MIHELISDVLCLGRFFVRHDLSLTARPPAVEHISWEVFRGRLLDSNQTRQTRQFTSWNIYQATEGSLSAEPLLSVKWDEGNREIHMVRAILCHVWEGFDAGGNVIQSRATTKWVRELVGTISLDVVSDAAELRREVTDLVVAALVGTSRLPLNSVEAPLPAFSLGQLAYINSANERTPGAEPVRTWQELLRAMTADVGSPVSLESLLRSVEPEQAAQVAHEFAARFAESALPVSLPALLRRMFTSVSLSPYTTFVDTTISFVKALVDGARMSAADEIDLWSWLLRQLGRHLTAYDLFTFHYRGANYPDALLLDAVLKRYLVLIEAQSDLFRQNGDPEMTKMRQRRRRALRQACLLRRYYEGHSVPDAPTSPGENARVLPVPHMGVPDEQIVNVSRRRKRLYTGEPLPDLLSPAARLVLHESVLDLAGTSEWRELGMAVFIDRPFGWGKAVGEPDLTSLLAHEAFSPSIARRRLQELERLARELQLMDIDWKSLHQSDDDKPLGLPAAQVAEPDRPVVSLADARRVADDFVILKTLRRGLEDALQAFDFAPVLEKMPFPNARESSLLVRLATPDRGAVLVWFDTKLRQRLEMETDLSNGFLRRGRRELPAAGLRVLRIWDEDGALFVVPPFAAFGRIPPKGGTTNQEHPGF